MKLLAGSFAKRYANGGSGLAALHVFATDPSSVGHLLQKIILVLLPFVAHAAIAEVWLSPASQDVLKAMRRIVAGRNFRGEDGMQHSYGEIQRDRVGFVLHGYAIRPDRAIVRVIDRLLPEANGMTLIESVVGLNGAWTYEVRPLDGGGFVVMPRDRLERRQPSRFVSRECRANGESSVCNKTIRFANGNLTTVRYQSVP